MSGPTRSDFRAADRRVWNKERRAQIATLQRMYDGPRIEARKPFRLVYMPPLGTIARSLLFRSTHADRS